MSAGYLLDTNVLSELMRPAPAKVVREWFARHANRTMYTSATTQAEILTGIALLPPSKRRDALASAAEQMFQQDFAGHCLTFDGDAAQHCALIVAARTRAGQPITTEDAQIAAIALTAGLPVVTRNNKDFSDIPGLTTINPWQAPDP